MFWVEIIFLGRLGEWARSVDFLLLSLQSVTTLIVIISLYCIKTSLLNCFVYIAFVKNRCAINLGEFISYQKFFAKKSGNPETLKK